MLSFVQRGIGSDTRPLGVVDAERPEVTRWRDRTGDEWIHKNDGTMWLLRSGQPDGLWTRSVFDFSHVLSCWGPLTPVTSP